MGSRCSGSIILRRMGMATARGATILPTFCSTRSSPPTISSSVPRAAVTSRASINLLFLQQQSSSNSPLTTRNGSLVAFEDPPPVAEAHGEAVAVSTGNSTPSAQALCSNFTPRDVGGAMSPDDGGGDEIQLAGCNRMVSVGDRRWRRRVRQRKRKHLELKDDVGSHAPSCFSHKCSSRASRPGYLTPREEAEFSFYLKEWARIEAEMKLCKTNEDHADPLRSAVPKASSLGRRNAERILLKAMECREKIILSYKRLVVSIAAPYEGKGLSLQDLVQEGCIGLLRGAETFDSKRGYKLSTYVYWWIKQAIIKAIAKKSRIVRLPGSMNREAAKIIEANSFLSWRLGRSPTHKEIADLIGTSVSRVQFICEKSRTPLSSDQPLDREGMTLKDIIPGPEETTPEMAVAREHITECLENLLHSLSEREEYVIRLHYGLNGETQKSCEEIGRSINLSRERVRQIHWSALRKLRENRNSIESLVKLV
ncbi:hypothetical protein Taro_007175 [Colocasia esculenta]|uniref:RNA polymerase sigma-70 domain-containing protein n=1 Tax=Colocasia esculenta TaxID=4460 RepID=A0A843TXF2_COLES|nr:hypothetical protein [Colocasia esculenta]